MVTEFVDVSSSVNDVIKSLGELKIYPNPTSDYLNITYTLNKGEDVSARIVDLKGAVAASLFNEHQEAGINSFRADITSLKSGMYVLEITAGNQNKSLAVTIR